MDQDFIDLKKEMQERFKQLPKVVQDAITSAEVEKRLRELANTHKLHLDQWTALENEVTLALLGFEPVENLPMSIQSEVGVDSTTAAAIAGDVSKIVFEPIRAELERNLEHPDAKVSSSTVVESVRTQMLAGTDKPQAPAVVPATPPQAPPTQKVERAQLPETYAKSVPSHERKIIEGDPYREQLV
jgi:hypothetical protein